MYKFKRTTNAFNYVFEKELAPGETIYIRMPTLSPDKRGVNDIGWQTDGEDVSIFGTLSSNPEDAAALWQRILPYDEVNKASYALKVVNSGTAQAKICLRAILN